MAYFHRLELVSAPSGGPPRALPHGGATLAEVFTIARGLGLELRSDLLALDRSYIDADVIDALAPLLDAVTRALVASVNAGAPSGSPYRSAPLAGGSGPAPAALRRVAELGELLADARARGREVDFAPNALDFDAWLPEAARYYRAFGFFEEIDVERVAAAEGLYMDEILWRSGMTYHPGSASSASPDLALLLLDERRIWIGDATGKSLDDRAARAALHRLLEGTDRVLYRLGEGPTVTALTPREAERLAYERGLHLASL